MGKQYLDVAVIAVIYIMVIYISWKIFIDIFGKKK